MIRIKSFSVRHVCGMESFGARQVFIKPLPKKRFKIQQVTGIFLN